MVKKEFVYRNAVNGEFVTEEYALANPETTEKETIEVHVKDIGYAVEALKVGKKVRRKIWAEQDYLELNEEGQLMYFSGKVVEEANNFITLSILAEDWEFIE